MGVKFKLSRTELLSLFNVMSLTMVLVRSFNDIIYDGMTRPEACAVKEIYTNLFLRMTKKADKSKAETTVTLNAAEAWAFVSVMIAVYYDLAVLEKTIIEGMINSIYQKTA